MTELLRKRLIWAGVRRVHKSGKRGAAIYLKPSIFRRYIGKAVLVEVYEVELSDEALKALEASVGEAGETGISGNLQERRGGREEG